MLYFKTQWLIFWGVVVVVVVVVTVYEGKDPIGHQQTLTLIGTKLLDLPAKQSQIVPSAGNWGHFG